LGSLGFDRQLQRTAPFKLLVIFRAKNDAYESATFGVDAFFLCPKPTSEGENMELLIVNTCACLHVCVCVCVSFFLESCLAVLSKINMVVLGHEKNASKAYATTFGRHMSKLCQGAKEG